MSTRQRCVRTIGLSVLLVISRGIGLGDEIADWNHIMLEATLTPPATPAPVSTRSTAIVQAAVFDAVNGIDPQYTPIHVSTQRSPKRFETCRRSTSGLRYFD